MGRERPVGKRGRRYESGGCSGMIETDGCQGFIFRCGVIADKGRKTMYAVCQERYSGSMCGRSPEEGQISDGGRGRSSGYVYPDLRSKPD